jgi:hypothetical protein
MIPLEGRDSPPPFNRAQEIRQGSGNISSGYVVQNASLEYSTRLVLLYL